MCENLSNPFSIDVYFSINEGTAGKRKPRQFRRGHLSLCGDHNVAAPAYFVAVRSLYSPVSVLMRITSPSLMKSGTGSV